MDNDFLFKVIIVGDSGVGKSNLISRYTQNKFNRDSKTTIGVEFGTKTIKHDNINICGQFWDTAGQERFRAVTTTYYRNVNGSVIVYDITNKESFENLEKWYNEVKTQGDSECFCIFVGNKCDLKDMRQVETDTGKEFAEKHGVPFMETSAADNTNVEEAFNFMLKEIYKKQSEKRNKKKEEEGRKELLPPVKPPSSSTNSVIKPHTKEEKVEQPAKKGCAC
ncbi:hypothetical protein ABK040_005186 [Willaertia magna]